MMRNKAKTILGMGLILLLIFSPIYTAVSILKADYFFIEKSHYAKLEESHRLAPKMIYLIENSTLSEQDKEECLAHIEKAEQVYESTIGAHTKYSSETAEKHYCINVCISIFITGLGFGLLIATIWNHRRKSPTEEKITHE